MWTEARHLVVATELEAQELLREWQDGEEFARLARTRSLCPTAQQDGHLGLFAKGHMPPELDEIFQRGEFGCLYGPVQTEYGYHLVEVLSRRPS
ncbi:MAG: peptidylprolyl isomerase [Planctomycetota bacterium]